MRASLSRRWWVVALAAAGAALSWMGRAEAAAAAGPGAAAAAQAAANGAACQKARPFYWEVGSADGALASGSVGAGAPARTTRVPIASASKILYSAYVIEQGLQPEDRPFLQLRSGFASFGQCQRRQTVAACEAAGQNGLLSPNEVGRFSYGGGHMQRLAASKPRTAKMTADQLGAELSQTLGVRVGFERAQPAGGAVMSAADFAAFLQRVMTGQLALGAMLGQDAVCTRPGPACPTADKSPVPVAWGYGLGHWVEAPAGDGSFSSPGAFGFYPWISGDRQLYGVVARSGQPRAWDGALCGAAIRQAFRGQAPAAAPAPAEPARRLRR